jgi:3-oxoacyl-[acyl-carrier protein] reductase
MWSRIKMRIDGRLYRSVAERNAGARDNPTDVMSGGIRGSGQRVAVSYDFTGRTAVVTGGAGGIGRSIAERLKTSGCRVWVWDIAPSDLDGIRSLTVDVTDSDQVRAAVAEIIGRDSCIDVLVNSAGHLGGYAPFEKLSPGEWQRIISVNLIGVFEACSQVLPHMKRTGWGRIVNMGSLAGKHGLPNLSIYSAASAGVIAFTKALALELADTEIRVNTVAPGPIATSLITQLGPQVVDSMIASSPLKRLGTVEEVAELVVWLCSDACTFSTGAVFDLSGGRAAY